MLFQFLVMFVVAAGSVDVKGQDMEWSNCPPSTFFCPLHKTDCCNLENETCHEEFKECTYVFKKQDMTIAEKKEECCIALDPKTKVEIQGLRQACVYLLGLLNYKEMCAKLEAEKKLEEDADSSTITRATHSTASGNVAKPTSALEPTCDNTYIYLSIWGGTVIIIIAVLAQKYITEILDRVISKLSKYRGYQVTQQDDPSGQDRMAEADKTADLTSKTTPGSSGAAVRERRT